MKRFLLILTTAIAPLYLHAQSVASLNINPDPVAASLANTGIARQADANAMNNNFAAAALSTKTMAVAASYGIWQPKATKTNVISAAGFYRIQRFAFGVQFKHFAFPTYSIVSMDGRYRGEFGPKDMAVALGVSYRLAESLSLGANLRFVSSSLTEDAKASAFGADIALKYERNGWQAGFSVCNLGTPVTYGGDRYTQPAMVRGGGAFSTGSFTASIEVDYLFSGALMAGLGVEYTIVDIVSLRGGFHYGDAAKAVPTYASLGMGVKFADVHIDAAFLTASQTLGNTLMVGLGYSF